MSIPMMAADAFALDSLLAEARSRTGGLDDFGPGDFREALRVLGRALHEEARLSDQGRALLREKLVAQLANRLVIEDHCKRYPEILRQRVDDPLVIVGLPRTGTTLLQRLLAVDPQFSKAQWWETRYPAPLPEESLAHPGERIGRARAEVAAMIEFVPQILGIHPLDAEQPDEEFMLMEHAFLCAMDSYVNVPGYTAWLDRQDQTQVYAYLKKMLQFLQWQQARRGIAPGRRWLLKSPQHLHTLELLFRVFPRAQVILTHRDPGKTIPSLASFIHTLWQIYSDRADPAEVGEQWNSRMARALRHGMRVREQMPAGAFLDVHFEDTVSDPLGVVERVYRFAGLDLAPELRAAMAAWLAANGRDKRAEHQYDAAVFGLDEARLARDYGQYRARYLAG
ncbi:MULTISPECIES: sulfotransferase family protein [unclassified Pseudomonas]|uniref:sulfotransferase family protein n=1 Tax=unclassified Pseudomonas TaxID=196821 RepID=UPI000DA8D6FE|nr:MULTISPECIES: sulfotransferase [unclassified Pseudomonas]MDW3711689.1 sulfotransferase [Pseudomonas sp. 2023EL-01195]PZE11133.1 sulfotransferase [Pseudomonas sp. 57B-090624]